MIAAFLCRRSRLDLETLILRFSSAGHLAGHRDVWSGGYGTMAAVIYTVLLLVAGMLDNVLKPLLLGRGVDAPMVVILLGALGGLATSGLLGMFVGATLLALGYQIFMRWVATDPDKAPAQREPQVAA